MKLRHPTPDPFNRLVFKEQRGKYFGGCAVIVGSGRNARSHMHATSGVQEASETTTDVFDAGYVIDFHGVKMSWVGEMIAETS